MTTTTLIDPVNAPADRSARYLHGSLLDVRSVWLTAVVGVLVLQLALTLSHRAWQDEWQALQIAMQSPTLADLLVNLRYEGHPALWYLMLRAIATIVPPYWVLPVAAATIALPIQWLILARAPFSRLERLMLATGALLLFESFTISRNLTFGVAAMLLVAACNRSRFVWLPIALLPQCGLLFGLCSIAFVALLARDGRLWFAGVAAWLVSAAIAAATVVPASDMVPAIAVRDVATTLRLFVERLGVVLLPWQTDGFAAQWNGLPPFGLGVVAGPLFVAFAWHQTQGATLERLILIGAVLATLLFSLLVYPLAARHLALIGVLLVCLRWQRPDFPSHLARRFFTMWLATGSLCGLAVAGVALTRPFDTAPEALAAIRERGLTDKRWIAFPENRGQGITALSGLAFEREGANCRQTFIRWNRASRIRTLRDLERYLTSEGHHGRFYLLTDFRTAQLPASLIREIAVIPPGYNGYAYVLSEVAPGAPDAPRREAYCVPRQRPLR